MLTDYCGIGRPRITKHFNTVNYHPNSMKRFSSYSTNSQLFLADTQGLSPPRKSDHAIVLQDIQEPVSVRPYRYPHHKKDEIERQVGELMQKGFI